MKVWILNRGDEDRPELCGVFLQHSKMEVYAARAAKLGMHDMFLTPMEIDIERDYYIPDNQKMYKITAFKDEVSAVMEKAAILPINIIRCNRMSTSISMDGKLATIYMWSISTDMAFMRSEQAKATIIHEDLWEPGEHFDLSVMA